MEEPPSAPNPQQAHYEAIHSDYEAHYYDAPSMAYRHRFIYRPLFQDLPLNNASVADLACGSGHNSIALRSYFPTVKTTGYDISDNACRDYERHTGFPAHMADLTLPMPVTESYDAALVIGGLHHCVADLKTSLENVAKMVKPGGFFMMMEPNDDFLMSNVRRAWYRKDKWFEADTEEALRHDALLELGQPYFERHRLTYFGGPAFYAVLNSLILRVPLKAKPALSKILFPAERLYGLLPGRAPYAAFLAVWRRTTIEPG
ncbi:class I SAM-dependent methyltransferase [Caenispirillum salinarum]|uniref:class I SAM-dependent methyltransferase n=1 Tax=Caenispirillum salinarum TaxID=859058 RepID=UPI0038517A09